MFYTFNAVMTDVVSAGRPARGQSTTTRSRNNPQSAPTSQNFRACRRCRQHRIKCSEKPCEPCRANNSKCVWTEEKPTAAVLTPISPANLAANRPMMAPAAGSTITKPVASHYASPTYTDGEDGGGEPWPLQHSCSCAQHPNTPKSCPSQSGDIRQQTPCSQHASPASNAFKTFHQFLEGLGMAVTAEEGELHQFPPLPSAEEGKTSTAATGLLPSAPTASETLNWDGQLYFVRLFWMSLAPLFPIMPESEFEALYAADGPYLLGQRTIEGALINGMTALGIQCAEATGSGARILSCSPTAASRSSIEYFRRCRDVLRDQDTSTTTCVHTIRCYILLTLYHLQANQLEKAYYLAGLGVRRAHMGRFHLTPAAHSSARVADDRIRVWWLLSWLDVYCSLQLGRPAAVQRSSNPCPPPSSPPMRFTPMHADVVSRKEASLDNYRFVLSKLTMIVVEALDDVPVFQSLQEMHGCSSTAGQSMARLSETIRQLETALDELPEQLLTRHGSHTPTNNGQTHRSRPTCSTLPHSNRQAISSASSTALTVGLPDWLQRQRLILELHYLDACLVLQRPFVLWKQIFSSDASITKHAESAFSRACSVLSMLHSIYSRSDILDRLTMVLPFIWNAIITIAAYVFVGPADDDKKTQLLKAMNNALAILEPLARINPDSLKVYQISQALAAELREASGGTDVVAMPPPAATSTSTTFTDDLFKSTFTGSLDLDEFLNDEVTMTDSFSDLYSF
ncbi:hypothetical protein NHJ13051_004418 [Beauveria bassiana]